MISAVAILVLSTALGLFYIQALCINVLRREFSQPFFQILASTIHLEFPEVGHTGHDNTVFNFSHARSALKSDFTVLTFLAKNGNPNSRRFSLQERILLGYFKVLFQCLPVCHAFHVREKETVASLKAVLYYLANLVGERVTATEGEAALAIN